MPAWSVSKLSCGCGREACMVSKHPKLWGGRDYTSRGRPAWSVNKLNGGVGGRPVWSVSTLGCGVGRITHREGGLYGQ